MQYETTVNQNYPPKSNNGFSIIELLATVALVSFLFSVAIPSVSSLSQKDRATNAANTLVATLNAARGEAITRNMRLTVCQSENRTECGTGGWDKGWILFTDAGVPGEVDIDDKILHFSEPLFDDMRLSSNRFESYISFYSDGTSNDTGSFQLCNINDQDSVTSICISKTGRMTLNDGACRGQKISCL